MVLLLNIILFVLGVFFVSKSSKHYMEGIESFHKKYFYVFLALHFGIALFHWHWSFENGIDVIDFHKRAVLSESWVELFGIGSTFIRFIIYPFVKLGVSYSTLFFLFSVLSYYGFLNYFKLLKPYIVNQKQKALYLLFLLPSFHFWSAPISKDSLVFFLMSVILIELKNRNYLLLSLSFIVIGFVRPHVVVVLLLAFILALFFEKNINKKHIVIAVLGFVFGSLCLLSFIKLPGYSLEAIYLKLEQYNKYGLKHNSHIDIFKTSYLERIFALLFRPMFLGAKRVFQYLVSIENIVVLLTLGYILFKAKFKKISLEVKYTLFTSLFLSLLIGVYIYNLGLASRMRLMIYPYLIYGLIISLKPNNYER